MQRRCHVEADASEQRSGRHDSEAVQRALTPFVWARMFRAVLGPRWLSPRLGYALATMDSAGAEKLRREEGSRSNADAVPPR
jgi:hypothetical protein